MPQAHWCLTSPSRSVVPDLVLSTVMTLAASNEAVRDLVWETTSCTVWADLQD
jgi:hypothetical protein